MAPVPVNPVNVNTYEMEQIVKSMLLMLHSKLASVEPGEALTVDDLQRLKGDVSLIYKLIQGVRFVPPSGLSDQNDSPIDEKTPAEETAEGAAEGAAEETQGPDWGLCQRCRDEFSMAVAEQIGPGWAKCPQCGMTNRKCYARIRFHDWLRAAEGAGR